MNQTVSDILNRRSIRSYKPDPVPEELIRQIVDCGLYAATGMGLQPWHFTVITDRKMLTHIMDQNRKVMAASDNEKMRAQAADPTADCFRGAPMAIVVSGQTDARWAEVDCANAVQNMAVAAHALGLGSVYLGSFRLAMDQPEYAFLLEELKIPAGYKPILALAIGYPDGSELPPRAERRENTVTWIR